MQQRDEMPSNQGKHEESGKKELMEHGGKREERAQVKCDERKKWPRGFGNTVANNLSAQKVEKPCSSRAGEKGL